MLTDAEARDLLHAAADTIEVEPAAPLPVVRRPSIWPMLVAAAAVIAIVVTTFALADRGSAPPPVAPPSPRPTLDANQIPPVLGLTPNEAEDLLTERGLAVRVVTHSECGGEVATGTSPPAGARFEPGNNVVLSVIRTPATATCKVLRAPEWELLRFALGVDAPPRLASEVTLYPGGGEPVVLSAAEAADPANWEICDGDVCGSALSILATAATQPATSGAGPVLEVWEQPRAFEGADACMGGANLDVEGGTYFGIQIAPPTDGIAICP